MNINLTVVDCFKRKPASTRSIRSPSSACSGGGLSHCAGPVDVRCSGTVAAMVSINVAQAARREAAARAAVKAAALRQLAKAEMGPASALSGGAAYMPIYSPEGCAVGQDRIQVSRVMVSKLIPIIYSDEGSASSASVCQPRHYPKTQPPSFCDGVQAR